MYLEISNTVFGEKDKTLFLKSALCFPWKEFCQRSFYTFSDSTELPWKQLYSIIHLKYSGEADQELLSFNP
jgi:hypothetical protein